MIARKRPPAALSAEAIRAAARQAAADMPRLTDDQCHRIAALLSSGRGPNPLRGKR